VANAPSAFDEVARRVRVVSPTSYRFDDRLVEADASAAAPGWMPTAGPELPPLVRQLQNQLYDRSYLRRGADAGAPRSSTDLTPTLSAANHGQPRWDPGWTIQQLDMNGMVWVARDGQSRTAWGGEFLTATVGTAPRVGSQVSLFVTHESAVTQSGFYFAFGDTLGDQIEELATLRFYWNVQPEEAPAVLETLADGLRRYAVPFRLKVLSTRELYPRPDAMVLYVADRYARVAAQVCRTAHRRLAAGAERETPLFTLRLAEGLGAAEDPGNGESFGMSRCRVAAEGLWNAFVQGASGVEASVEIVRAHARRYGLDPDRPWLNPRSADLADFPADD
jgi:hypothetical protein